MMRMERCVRVANNKELILPKLDSEDLTMITEQSVCTFIQKAIHNPRTMGWPDAANDFASMGLILQAITEKTARVVMVVDDERARKNLAIYLAAYEYWGYTLLIDEATFARPAVLESEPDASSNDLTTSETSVDTLGMEVA